MNIYNKLFILERCKYPVCWLGTRTKIWQLNLSKDKYYYRHRGFDLPASIYYNRIKLLYIIKLWLTYGNRYRIIGNSIINLKQLKHEFI